MVRVKICGITRLEDARFAAGAGADYLGFVQDPASAAYVEPARVRAILEWIHGLDAVGVFTTSDPEEINRICSESGCALAQLDGPIPPEAVGAVAVPTIKSFVVQHDASVEQLLALMDEYHEAADFMRLDTGRTSLWGEDGESFSWRVVRALSAEFDMFLAGGLTAANVPDAVATMRPFAIDVESSMEVEPGVKDVARMEALFEAVRQADAPRSRPRDSDRPPSV